MSHDVSALSAAYPIALFPVRLETRFGEGVKRRPVLRIRIYPDAIHADGHRAALTDAERDDAIKYWKDGWHEADELAAWRALVNRHSPERAAWLVAAMTPVNLGRRPSAARRTPDLEPSFPAILRASDILPSYVARCLPSGWLAVGYRDGVEVARAASRPVRRDEALYLSFAGHVDEDDPHAIRDELRIEPELLWTVDYEEAYRRGMAITMPLSGVDARAGFDRLIVVGVRTAATGTRGAEELAALLDAQHYTRGLALMRQGTPTNSTTAGPAGYPRVAAPEVTFAVERDPERFAIGSDAHALSVALGLPDNVTRARGPGPTRPTVANLGQSVLFTMAERAHPLDRIEGAHREEGAAAAAMNRALWPCLGYYLERLLMPLVSRDELQFARSHFHDHVRGRGPLPSLRVGRVPYGILPATSLSRWQPAPMSSFTTGTGFRQGGIQAAYFFEASVAADPIETRFVALLNKLRERFLGVASSMRRVGTTEEDPDADLMAVLVRDASSRELRVRPAYGAGLVDSAAAALGDPQAAREAAEVRSAMMNSALTAAGLSGSPHPLLTGLTFADDALRLRRSWVTAAPSESDLLEPNYIWALGNVSLPHLRVVEGQLGPATQLPVLYLLLRHALWLECLRVGMDAAYASGRVRPSDVQERELHGMTGDNARRPTPAQILAEPLEGVTGGDTLASWLTDIGSSDPWRAPIEELRAAFRDLQGRPTAELERLLTETLDVCSHRLDAWLTSMATRRLAAMRANHPTGVHLGGYGWVEKLRAQPDRAGNAGGFIHAPSPAQAATAAILRNAHLSRRGEARKQAAVDLSSERVRGALELLDAVRQGIPLAGVLGFFLERALHEKQLDEYIAKFRERFPLAQDPAATGDAAAALVAAARVTDGLAVWERLAGSLPLPADMLPHENTLQAPAMKAVLAGLADRVDALADVLTAESLHQAIQGKTDRAAASIASLAGGGAIPVPEVVATPSTGTSVVHRVVIAFDEVDMPPGWSSRTPRHLAEPRLSAWLGSRLGSPERVNARASYPDPTAGEPERRATLLVKLADLEMSPLDVLAMAASTDDSGAGELEARLRAKVTETTGAVDGVLIDHMRAPDASGLQLTMLELLDLVRLLAEVVARARPLVASDLLPAGAPSSLGSVDTAALDRRADDAVRGLEGVRDSLDPERGARPEGLSAALRDALGYGVRAAMPRTPARDTADPQAEIAAQAGRALIEVRRRLLNAARATTGAARIAAIFESTYPIIPTFTPANALELRSALERGPALVGAPGALREWLEGAARVRPPLAALRLAAMSLRATGGSELDPCLAQVPHVDQPWVAASFDPSDARQRPRAGTVAITFARSDPWRSSDGCAGLLLDEWSERIPAAIHDTAVAVHHDTPGAEAPQCILLAVPPRAGPTWDLDSLLAILHETYELAGIRSVDGDELGDLELLARGIYIAANVEEDPFTAGAFDVTVANTAVREPE